MSHRAQQGVIAFVVGAGLAVLAALPAAAQGIYRPSSQAARGAYPSYYPPPPIGYPHGRPYECDVYARDNAMRYVPHGAGVGSGAVRGAVGGAVFGAIVGGSKGARRGAVAGGGLGAVAAGARASHERAAVHQLAYDDCMFGFRR